MSRFTDYFNMKYFIALISILLGSFAQYFLKLGMNNISGHNMSLWNRIIQVITNISIWEGLSCYALSLFLWLYVLSTMELSKAYPMVSLGYVLTLFIGYFYLDESITTYKIAGIILICIGVCVLVKG